MALRDQPYFPLYAQDFLSDEKLNLCSASAQGVFIKLMCIFHKSDTYGGILFKQKDKQKESTVENFAFKFSKLLPFDYETIKNALDELLDEQVLTIEGDFIFQKRMVKDGEVSIKRSKSAKTGGGNPDLFKQKDKQTIQQKDKQNPVYEIEIDNEIVNDNLKRVRGKLCSHFKISEQTHFTQFKLATEFLQVISSELDYFETQLENYIAYSKGAAPKYQILFSNFIGSQREKFADGRWNKTTWPEVPKLKQMHEIGKNQNAEFEADFAKHFGKKLA